MRIGIYVISHNHIALGMLSMMINCIQSLCKNPTFLGFSSSPSSSSFLQSVHTKPYREATRFESSRKRKYGGSRGGIVCGGLLPIDPWSPTIDSQSIASQLFALSLFPYIGFLYFITKSKSAPKLTLFGFYFLLVFVGATGEFLYIFPLFRFLLLNRIGGPVDF
ncbi:hypothetical protein U1Q18_021140 [Sarracenia purpurea var. burkii]